MLLLFFPNYTSAPICLELTAVAAWTRPPGNNLFCFCCCSFVCIIPCFCWCPTASNKPSFLYGSWLPPVYAILCFCCCILLIYTLFFLLSPAYIKPFLGFSCCYPFLPPYPVLVFATRVRTMLYFCCSIPTCLHLSLFLLPLPCLNHPQLMLMSLQLLHSLLLPSPRPRQTVLLPPLPQLQQWQTERRQKQIATDI